jgi:FkbH-like protein
MIKHLVGDNVHAHQRQQLETALALLEVALAEGRTPQQAGRAFGVWMKIAIRQCPDFFVEEAIAADWIDALEAEWSEVLGNAAPGLLDVSLDAAKAMLRPASGKPSRVLFIGDCLLWDASLQLQITAQVDGVTVEPTIMAQRLGADLRRELAKRNDNEFDLVVYSPFSYEFSGEYAFATAPGAILRAPRKASRMLNEALADVGKTIETLGARFECPIYVHTVSGVRQSRSDWRGALIRAASLPGRIWASRRLNKGLDDIIATLNRERDRPIARIHELPPGSRLGAADELGFIAYDAGEIHPTRLALELARGPYLRAVRVAAQLADKKLVVCDLDNTLWDGVIGEGEVVHYHDRQQTLLDLKARGVVLAIASKNDPKNMIWDGATLSKDDFVAQKINWSPKAANIQTIAQQLNLNPSSFVFLDDRPDERAMVTEAMAGLVALDPNEAETWAMLRHWAETSQRSALQDRTKMYKERAEREEFLNSIAARSDEIADMYRSLGLQLSLRYPNEVELTRVVELINRTNQFNTTAARTTLQEMDVDPGSRRILISEVHDKFGEMGIVGVMVAALGDPWRITHFVLSCRVFGFGIEDAMLNAAKRWSDGAARIQAELIETPANGPCRDVYERNGFSREGRIWTFDGASPIVDPSWLTIDDETNHGASRCKRG